jgi:hypothetical protein
MPCIFITDMRQIYIFLPTINYALHIPGRYVTDLLISLQIKYALFIHDRYVAMRDSTISPQN